MSLDLSIVIPAYKESTKIRRDIMAAFEFVKSEALNAEIIVIDDGSPDDTFCVAQALTAEVPILRVETYQPNGGKGHALRTGVALARGRNVLFADAGLCVPYDVARIGITMLDIRMCDVAHGSRRMRGSVKRAQPFYRRLGSKLYSLFIHTFMGIPRYISDTQCGFKLYRREVAHALYGAAFTDGFMFDVEIILRALRGGYTILEFPVLWSNDADTRFNPLGGGAVRVLRELMMIQYGLFLERRDLKHPQLDRTAK